MHPSLEEFQQWMEDNRVSMTELKGFADRILRWFVLHVQWEHINNIGNYLVRGY